MNATTKTETSALSVKPASQVDLSPQTFEQAITFSEYLANSDMVPKDFKGKPGNCLIAMQWGAEVGLKPLQSLQNIAVINGRPCLWGDSVIALVRASPACEYVTESDDGHVATCRVKRRGEDEQVRTFSMDDAKQAGLVNKEGPWKQYPKRMRQMRARAFALRDVFPDVLRGMPVAEEVMDLPKDMGTAEVVSDWSEDQLNQGRQAAEKGTSAYGRFWQGLGREVQQKLVRTKEHADFKEQALQADRNRTVDAPAPAPAPQDGGSPVKSFEQVKQMIEAAKDEAALAVALDWANALPKEEEGRAAELLPIYEARLAALKGGAQ